MTFALVMAAVAMLVAGAAVVQARSAKRRADRLAESYWDLHYEVGQLKVRTNRLEGPVPPADTAPTTAAPERPAAVTTSFVPLSSLKK